MMSVYSSHPPRKSMTFTTMMNSLLRSCSVADAIGRHYGMSQSPYRLPQSRLLQYMTICMSFILGFNQNATTCYRRSI